MADALTGFVVVLTFMMSVAHVDEKVLLCKSWHCVEEVRAAAPTSPLLSRIRVYSKANYTGGWLTIDDRGIFPPMLDEWLN